MKWIFFSGKQACWLCFIRKPTCHIMKIDIMTYSCYFIIMFNKAFYAKTIYARRGFLSVFCSIKPAALIICLLIHRHYVIYISSVLYFHARVQMTVMKNSGHGKKYKGCLLDGRLIWNHEWGDSQKNNGSQEVAIKTSCK